MRRRSLLIQQVRCPSAMGRVHRHHVTCFTTHCMAICMVDSPATPYAGAVSAVAAMPARQLQAVTAVPCAAAQRCSNTFSTAASASAAQLHGCVHAPADRSPVHQQAGSHQQDGHTVQLRRFSNQPETAVYSGPTTPSPKRFTLRQLRAKYRSGTPITMVTAYDYPSAVHVSATPVTPTTPLCRAAAAVHMLQRHAHHHACCHQATPWQSACV